MLLRALFRLRCFLIDLLARDDVIVCNAKLGGRSAITIGSGQRAFIVRTHIHDTEAGIRFASPSDKGQTE